MSRAAKRYSSPWLILTLLLLAVVVSFIDRQVVGVLVDPIRADLGITDFQVGLIGGPAFFVLYLVGGVIGGWAVDRYDRPLIVGAGMALWSMMTALCGFAGSFGALALGRMGVGFGEGTLGPGVHSLIADSFDRKRLPMAMSIYSAASAFGSGVSLFVGGLILQHAVRIGVTVPLVGRMAPWQLTFLAVSLPGFLLTPLLVGLLRIPPRAAPVAYRDAGLTGDILAFWRPRKAMLTLYTLGVGLVTGAKLSFVLWIPTLLSRIHHMTPAAAGGALGTMILVFGILGSLLWGDIAGRLARRGREDAAFTTMLWATGAFAMAVLLPPLMPSGGLVLLFMAPCLMLAQSFIGLGHAAIQLTTPSALRGRVSALYNGIATLLGVMVGPTGVGALSTYFFADDRMLGWSIALMTGTICAAGFACLAIGAPYYRRALGQVGAHEARIPVEIGGNAEEALTA